MTKNQEQPNQFIPENLWYGKCYKYRPIGKANSLERERLRQIIVDREIFFCSLDSVNDYHDGMPYVQKATLDETRQIIINSYGEKGKEIGAEDLIERVRENTDEKLLQENMHQVISNKSGIFCTSSDDRSNTQWAYYADSHQGVCLEFDITVDSAFCPVEVSYEEVRPVLDYAGFFNDDEYRTEALFKAVTTKSNAWELESEVRFLDRRPGPRQYPKDHLTAVIFGLNANQEYIDFVVSLLKEAGAEIELKQCAPKIATYELDCIPLVR